MGAVTYPTLEHVAMEARPYPTQVLEGCDTGLVLFAAAFLGHNDAIHFAEAGVRGFCVDSDGERLAEMAQLYPRDWQWAVDDVWTFSEAARTLGEQWDVVSLDPFTGEMMERVRVHLGLWMSLARRVVIVGVDNEVPEAMVPTGWEIGGYVERSSIASWLVLERDADA